MIDKKLKILIITRYFPPYHSIASLRPYSWAKYWTQAGHEVHVLTYPEEPDAKWVQSYDLSEFNIHFVPNPWVDLVKAKLKIEVGQSVGNVKDDRRGLIDRVLKHLIDKLAHRLHDCRMPSIHDLWYSSAFKEVGNTSWDVVVSTYAPPVTHLVARALKRNGRARVWCADFRDLWVDHTIAQGLFPFTACEKHLEKSVCLEADVVTVVSQPQADMLSNKYKNINVKVMSNGFDCDDLNLIPAINYFSDEKITLLYAGTIFKEKRDPSPLFEAVNLLRDEPTNCNLSGRLQIIFIGGNFMDLNALIDQYNLNDIVRYAGYVDRITSLQMQRDATVLLFLENDVDCNKGVMTGKIFEYLHSGTEIWGIGITENSLPGNLIVSSNAGKTFGNDVYGIKKALARLLSSNAKQPINVDKTVINQYSREIIANRMLSLFRES